MGGAPLSGHAQRRRHAIVTGSFHSVGRGANLAPMPPSNFATKALLGGIDPWEFRDACLRLGFRSCEVHFEWFLGQGSVMLVSARTASDSSQQIVPADLQRRQRAAAAAAAG